MPDIKTLTQNRWPEVLTRLGVDGSLLDGKHHAFPEIGCNTDGFRYIDKQGDGYCSLGNGEFGTGFDLLMKLNDWDFAKTASEIEAVMGWGDADYIPPTKEELAARQAKHNADAKAREQALAGQYKIAAKQSLATWGGASIADDSHPYLKVKKVKAYGVNMDGDCLLIPVRIGGNITSIQRIKPDGSKLFQKGGEISGGYHSIVGADAADMSRIYIAEGYATAATVREATGCHVAVAFNAGNLGKVASAIRSKLPDIQIIIAGDNDESQTGETKGMAAADSVGGLFTMPPDVGNDWNDYAATHGLDVVRDEIEKQIKEPSKALSLSSIEVQKTEISDPLTAAVERLAALSPLEYDQVRAAEAEVLNVRASTLDAEVKKARKAADTENDIFQDIEPWDDVVDGGALLDDMVEIFNRYAVLPNHAPEVAALWIMNTYVHDAGYNSPMIMITSPEKRCGKTTTLNLFQALVNKPLPAGNISSAAIYRSIEKWQPTLLIDEADTFLKNNEEVAGVINSGHTKPSAFVVRCDGDNNEPKRFSTWCPKIIAGIGSQRDTLEDRSIIFPLRRKLPHEQVERLRLDLEGFDILHRKCLRWAADNFTKCKHSNPAPIQDLEDRANDNWMPLLSIADLCGWSEKARMAAVLIRGEIEQSESIDTILLKDIQAIYKEQRVERLASQRICELLAAIDDRPWSEWSKGRPITTNRLAGRLKMFGVHSKVMRLPNGDNLKGYELAAFSDAFIRYCNSKRHNVTSLTQPQKTEIQSVTSKGRVTLQNERKPIYSNGCDVVTVQNVTPANSEPVASSGGRVRGVI